jgi:hypothetical protein
VQKLSLFSHFLSFFLTPFLEFPSGLPAFPGHGRPRDGELARLRKEVKVLREANGILKKAACLCGKTALTPAGGGSSSQPLDKNMRIADLRLFGRVFFKKIA